MLLHSHSRIHRRVRGGSARRAGIISTLVLLTLMAAASAFAQDILIRDCPTDNGSSPSGCSPWYYSPDVWLRLAPDNGLIDQAPIAYQPAYIYIRMTNTGNTNSCCGTLHLYYRDASTGLSDWPTHWVNYAPGGIIRADEIDKIQVCNIPPGATQTYMIPWGSVPPNIFAGSHHCLLVRWVAKCDPMQVPEGTDIYQNVVNNNNIVHKNCIPTQPGTPPTPVSVFNPLDHAVTTQLRLDALDNENGGNVFDVQGFGVKVTLPDELLANWNGEGTNVEQAEGGGLRVTGPHATIDGLTLPGAGADGYTDYAVNVEMTYPDPDDIPADQAQNVYAWTIEQHDDGNDIGDGVAFEIRLSGEDDAANQGGLGANGGGRKIIKAPVTSPRADLNLSARPNISTGSTAISYVLPRDENVTLAIYDANGRLVSTLLSKEIRSSGAHEVEWDGTASNGTLVPSGTYFYRLITPTGTVEQQLKIVR